MIANLAEANCPDCSQGLILNEENKFYECSEDCGYTISCEELVDFLRDNNPTQQEND